MQTTISKLADLTGMDRRTISKRLASITPVDHGKVGHFYDSATALRLIYQRADADGVLDPQVERALLDKERRIHQEMVNRAKSGELIERDDIFRAIDHVAIACREHLMGIPGRYASVFAGEQDAMKIEQTLAAEIRTALEGIASMKF